MSKYSNDGHEMILRRRPSPWPYYVAGAVWFLYSMVFPMYRIWDFLIAAAVTIAIFTVSKKWLFKPYDVWEKAKTRPLETGDDTADGILAAGRDRMRELRAARGEVENLIVRDKLEKIIGAAEGVFAHVREHPAKAIRIRKMTDYYLPTVTKLVEYYAQLERQSVRGENITQGMKDIGGILDTVEQAFKKQLDALFDDTALDIITDVEVLEKMLAGEGLSKGIINN